jgi:hypothetical protein
MDEEMADTHRSFLGFHTGEPNPHVYLLMTAVGFEAFGSTTHHFAYLGTTTPTSVCGVFAHIGMKRRIACGLLLGHIVAYALHGVLESKSLTGDETPGEDHR